MQNNALVNFGDKKNAARAIKRLHNKFMFPGCSSSRFISVQYARKNSYNTPSAKNPPSRKPSKVTWPFYLPPFFLPFILCFLLHTGNCCKQATGYKIVQHPQRKKSTKPKAIEGTMAIVFTTFFSWFHLMFSTVHSQLTKSNTIDHYWPHRITTSKHFWQLLSTSDHY